MIRAIPRFVASENYASSFGYQWNVFKRQQLDSVNGTTLSRDRFFSETGWSAEWLQGKWIADLGCGPGRFLEVASRYDCNVVGVDLSSAIDAAADMLANRGNVHLVQASLFQLPFRDHVFDGAYCIGVLQHTPDAYGAARAFPRIVRFGGRIAVTVYEKKPWTFLNGKYLVRPITRRMKAPRLLRVLRFFMPLLFAVSEVLFRIPFLGRIARFFLPIANYVEERQLTWRQRYEWALLDTLDMLSPQFDSPLEEAKLRQALASSGIVGIQRKPHAGLNVVGEVGGG